MSVEPTLTPMAQADGSSEEPEPMAAFPAPYGAYLLLHRLARGGMGNVFLAKTGGMMGIEKHCVVKTLRARFTHDPEYVERFMDEARVVVQLSHRNICPVFDVGRVGQSYYLAMELVIGRDVRRLLNALEERNRALPEACAIHIACEMLDALDYAHRHVDNTTGMPLHLVHRDISPQNVMISVEGEVKLIDFGLAESGREISNEHVTTGSSTVMGKMSYMAPEQARGEIVDARADQFAAAVVAYELIRGERYYAGLTQQQIWQQAGSGMYKPAGLADLDEELREILARGLASEKEDRYPATGDLREALLVYARKRNLHAGARDLRGLMGELLVDDLRETRELLQRFAHVSSLRRTGFDVNPDETMELMQPTEVYSIATSGNKPIHDPTEMFRVSPSTSYPVQRPRGLMGIAAAVSVVAIAAGLALMIPSGGGDAQPPPEPPLVVVADEPSPLAPDEAVAADVPAAAEPSEDEPEPEPANGGTRRKNTKTRTEPKKKAEPPPPPPQRPVAAPVTFLVQLEYVKKHCPNEPCTRAATSAGPLSALQPSELLVYKSSLDACYKRCKR
jgi:eukaryotic-like serine/threonine-protein kinase